jgi:hypothetical protein
LLELFRLEIFRFVDVRLGLGRGSIVLWCRLVGRLGKRERRWSVVENRFENLEVN